MHLHPTTIDTGHPNRPTIEAPPYGYEPCPDCNGCRATYTASGEAEPCPCGNGLVAIETPPPVGEPVRGAA